MITKVDKANAHGAELSAILKEYIQTQYLGFYNGLKKICKDCEINNGTVDIVPFSLGEVLKMVKLIALKEGSRNE